MKEIRYEAYAGRVLEQLPKGAFLTTAADGKTNAMTIGWGSVGYMWKRPVFTVMVRKSRYTYALIEANPQFTVSVPLGDMQAALALCGSKSGRDTDKFAAAGLVALPGQKVAVPVIGGAGLHFECKAVYKQAMGAAELDEAVAGQWYADNDWHTLYYGEILAAYTEA